MDIWVDMVMLLLPMSFQSSWVIHCRAIEEVVCIPVIILTDIRFFVNINENARERLFLIEYIKVQMLCRNRMSLGDTDMAQKVGSPKYKYRGQMWKECETSFIRNPFEMRLLKLRIDFYLLRTFCPHLGSFFFWGGGVVR